MPHRLLIVLSLGIALLGANASAQLVEPAFQSWKDDPSFKRLDYPFAFVATYRDVDANGNQITNSSGSVVIRNGGNLGTDVLEAGAPSRGQELWVLLPNGDTARLFPIIGVHDTFVDYPLGPTDGRINGSVNEPSISIDGRRIYFTYFHDALNFPPYCCGSTGHSNFDGWPGGGDLYAIDIGPIIDDPNFPVANLRVSRLTETTDYYAAAMNPGAAQTTEIDTGGIVNTSAVEVDTELGRKLMFVSDRRLLRNANPQQTKRNKNFNLFIADVEDRGVLRLRNIRQYQYFTASSVLSPNRLRQGVAVSYQAHTEDARQWVLQRLTGDRWDALYGYGIGNEAAHLGTFCVKTTTGSLPAGDYEVLTQYYNQNNNGFGFIVAQDMSSAGLNTYHHPSSAGVGYLPRQVGSYNITPGVKKGDYKSVTSSGEMIGKFTAPACGGPDELFLTFDPGWGNHKNDPYPYRPEIVMTDLEPADPLASSESYQVVLRSPDPRWGAVWGKPVMDWQRRLTGIPHVSGESTQSEPASVIDATSSILAGLPFATLGTSSLYNTDIKPVDCKDAHGFYDPFETNNTADQIFNNIDSLTRLIQSGPGDVQAETGSCAKPTMDDIFGIAIYMTSNKISDGANSTWSQGYGTDASLGNTKEAKRLLGVFELGMAGQSDASFKAKVPANVPLEFHLIDRNGMKLADVRSWHSLKPRESRVDCGGCHNHRPNQAIPWESSDSADESVASLDFTNQTPTLTFDAMCEPTLTTDAAPTTQLPVWQDLSPDVRCDVFTLPHVGGRKRDA